MKPNFSVEAGRALAPLRKCGAKRNWRRQRLISILLATVLSGLVAGRALGEAPPGKPIDAPATVPPIPMTMLEALRAGGVNLVFDWYDVDNYNPRGFDAELPLIRAAGARHVRPVISMDVLEEGATGTLRPDRWDDLKGFVAKARAEGLVTIIDVHNTGQKNPDGTWTHDYMARIVDPVMQERHISLLRDISRRTYTELDRDWVIINPANEPLSSVWYDYQDRLMPVIREACPDCVVFAMATTWQVIGATIRELNPRARRWWDDRFIADVHMYSPLSLTHCSFPGQPNKCPGKTWPGHYADHLPTGGRLDGTWVRQVLEHEFRKLWDWRAESRVTVHFSEIGTTADLADEPRSAYISDVVSILRAAGVGWTCYEWHQNFGIKNAPLTKAACLPGGRSSQEKRAP